MTIDLHLTKDQFRIVVLIHIILFGAIAWLMTRRSLRIEWSVVFLLSIVGQLVYFFGLSTGQWPYLMMATIVALLLSSLALKYMSEIDQSHKTILSVINPLVAFLAIYFVYWIANE